MPIYCGSTPVSRILLLSSSMASRLLTNDGRRYVFPDDFHAFFLSFRPCGQYTDSCTIPDAAGIPCCRAGITPVRKSRLQSGKTVHRNSWSNGVIYRNDGPFEFNWYDFFHKDAICLSLKRGLASWRLRWWILPLRLCCAKCRHIRLVLPEKLGNVEQPFPKSSPWAVQEAILKLSNRNIQVLDTHLCTIMGMLILCYKWDDFRCWPWAILMLDKRMPSLVAQLTSCSCFPHRLLHREKPHRLWWHLRCDEWP